jgi:hypothetical protein
MENHVPDSCDILINLPKHDLLAKAFRRGGQACHGPARKRFNEDRAFPMPHLEPFPDFGDEPSLPAGVAEGAQLANLGDIRWFFERTKTRY